jgi:hypothetical protein
MSHLNLNIPINTRERIRSTEFWWNSLFTENIPFFLFTQLKTLKTGLPAEELGFNTVQISFSSASVPFHWATHNLKQWEIGDDSMRVKRPELDDKQSSPPNA